MTRVAAPHNNYSLNNYKITITNTNIINTTTVSVSVKGRIMNSNNPWVIKKPKDITCRANRSAFEFEVNGITSHYILYYKYNHSGDQHELYVVDHRLKTSKIGKGPLATIEVNNDILTCEWVSTEKHYK